MAPAPDPCRPPKPLKILTLDGGGLQAISTLLILNKLLETVGKQNCRKGMPLKKPKPCEVFDTIAGIGAGGWLAILLGRFRMDITSCLSEWYRIMQCIEPRSKSDELRLRLIQHCYFDTDRLVEQVDHLTKVYGTGDCLFETDPEGARTRHVFVAALKSDAKGYKLFRTYNIPKSAKLPGKLLGGPQNPKSFKISSAFGVTGAAKYFTPAWKEHMEHSGHMKFMDTKFPKPHNITELALDEMWAIYGTDVPLSVVVNIGPGLPNDVDVRQIARRFSWGLHPAGAHTAASTKRARSPATKQSLHAPSKKQSIPITQPDGIEQDTTKPAIRFENVTAKGDLGSGPIAEGEQKSSMNRTDTFGSIKGRSMEFKLRRLEDDIEKDVQAKLATIYPEARKLYYRLALPKAPQGTAQNDSAASGVTFDATMDYLKQPVVDIIIDEVAKRIPTIPSAA